MKKMKDTPEGWMKKDGFDDEWFLKSDRGADQPLVTFIKEFDSKIDYSRKNGFQCTLGEIAGRYCYIAPLRKESSNARKHSSPSLSAEVASPFK